MVRGPRVEILDRAEASKRGFVQRNADLERRENLRADLLAHRVHVIDASRKAISPDDTAVAVSTSSTMTASLPIGNLHGAPQAIADPQQAPDVAEIRIGCAQTEGRSAGCDEQPMQARQVRDQLVGQRAGERRVALIATDESKRQHRQRRPGDSIETLNQVSEVVIARARPIPAGPAAALREALACGDEAISLAVDGPDEVL